MAKECWTFDHPADLGLEARGDSLAELFEALGEGLADQICPRDTVRGEQTRHLEAEADDRESLLVEFLAALLRLFDLERFLVSSVRVERIDEASAAATVSGETYDPARHEIGAEVKAVTYHELKVAQEGDSWTARVIVDV